MVSNVGRDDRPFEMQLWRHRESEILNQFNINKFRKDTFDAMIHRN